MVSGGRGELGECGGINNPIHYVRLVLMSFCRHVLLQKKNSWNFNLSKKDISFH